MHSHDEQHVDLVEEWFEQLESCVGIQRQSDATTGIADLLQSFADIVFRFGFDMNGDGIRTGIDKTRHVVIGMFDHQMHVEWQVSLFANETDDGWTERNVVYEMAVHDVAMDPISAGRLDFVNFLSQA